MRHMIHAETHERIIRRMSHVARHTSKSLRHATWDLGRETLFEPRSPQSHNFFGLLTTGDW
jgi:hypothetical protein